jgi:multidrug resistance efflux pump
MRSTLCPPMVLLLLLSSQAFGQKPNSEKKPLRVAGHLVPAQRVLVHATVPGVIERLDIQEGDLVKKGGVLVRLNHDAQSLRVQAAEAQLRIAMAGLQRTRAGIDAFQARFQVAEADLQRAQANLTASRTELKRLEQLADNKAISQSSLARARRAAEMARAEVQGKEAELEGLRKDLVTRKAEVVIAEAEVKLAETKLEQARQQLGRHEIRAPITGTVLSVPAQVGGLVNPSRPDQSLLAEIADLSRLEVVAALSVQDVARLAVGARCQVQVTGTNNTYPGKLTRLSPVVDPNTRSLTARVSVQLPVRTTNVRPGMMAIVTFLPPAD